MQPNARMPSCDKHRKRLQFDWKVPFSYTYFVFIQDYRRAALYCNYHKDSTDLYKTIAFCLLSPAKMLVLEEFQVII